MCSCCIYEPTHPWPHIEEWILASATYAHIKGLLVSLKFCFVLKHYHHILIQKEPHTFHITAILHFHPIILNQYDIEYPTCD